MNESLKDKAAALRNEAWAAVQATKEYALFQALDTAVSLAGGQSNSPRKTLAALTPVLVSPSRHSGGDRRISQGDAAEQALQEAALPLAAAALLEAARSKGANVGGEKPMVSFTSTLSKDERFYSLRKDGSYFWWLKNVPLPEAWDEAADDLLRDAASSDSSQEGGDGHQANNTNLT